jgi:hypothetical protein
LASRSVFLALAATDARKFHRLLRANQEAISTLSRNAQSLPDLGERQPLGPKRGYPQATEFIWIATETGHWHSRHASLNRGNDVLTQRAGRGETNGGDSTAVRYASIHFFRDSP